MTVPQRSAASKAILLLLSVLATFTLPVHADDDTPADRETLFSCGTGDAATDGYLELSGIAVDVDRWVDLRFEWHADGDGQPAYSFPPAGTDPKTVFLFSHSDGPEGYLVPVRWADGGRDYTYYSLAIPPDPATENDMGGSAAGLAISRDGRLIERIACGERPYMFISYMRDAMSCDVSNPYGDAACRDDPAERREPIDVDAIGIVP